jgi:hypothetical protein
MSGNVEWLYAIQEPEGDVFSIPQAPVSSSPKRKELPMSIRRQAVIGMATVGIAFGFLLAVIGWLACCETSLAQGVGVRTRPP